MRYAINVARRTVEYPDWAEKYRGKGRTIRKIKDGYGLYRCTSEYVKGGPPKSKQVYLGIITEKDGFIPKKTGGTAPAYIEYGFSKFLMQNFKRDITRRVYQCSNQLLELGIIFYIFDSIDDAYLQISYLTYSHIEQLKEYAQKINHKRIERVRAVIGELLKKKVPNADELHLLRTQLILCVVEAGPNSSRKPALPEALQVLYAKYDLKF